MPQNSTSTKILKILASYSYQAYFEDQQLILEPWQHLEPASMEPMDRYNFDKEDYLNAFWNSDHNHSTNFNESELIERLIKNLENAKHPVFIDYRKYLVELLNRLNTSQEEIHENETDIRLDSDPRSMRNVIIELINNVDVKGWKYAFKNIDDFNAFVSLLESYFKNQNDQLCLTYDFNFYTGSKSRMAKVLRAIHKIFTEKKDLRNDHQFLDIVGSINVFNGDSYDKIYNSLVQ